MKTKKFFYLMAFGWWNIVIETIGNILHSGETPEGRRR